jgi:hypothetical protein
MLPSSPDRRRHDASSDATLPPSHQVDNAVEPHGVADDLGRKAETAVTAISRYKALIGPSLRARTLPAQKTEARAACAVLNRMTRLGMPMSQRVA